MDAAAALLEQLQRGRGKLLVTGGAGKDVDTAAAVDPEAEEQQQHWQQEARLEGGDCDGGEGAAQDAAQAGASW